MMIGQARSSVVVIRDSTPHDHPETVPASVRDQSANLDHVSCLNRHQDGQFA
jgi:hypothetical protein